MEEHSLVCGSTMGIYGLISQPLGTILNASGIINRDHRRGRRT